jgi:hypothetical protein
MDTTNTTNNSNNNNNNNNSPLPSSQSNHTTRIKSILSPSTSSSSSSSSSPSSSSSKEHRKSVSFESLHIRTYHRVLGDHPCCTTGLPITFGWNPIEDKTIEIEEYENNRSPRRARQDMRLNDETRRNILCHDSVVTMVESSSSGSSSSDDDDDNNDDDVGNENQEQQHENNNTLLLHEGLLSKIDLKRAERRLYRNRERIRRRIIANTFFACPSE